jgi:hypothetical protein
VRLPARPRPARALRLVGGAGLLTTAGLCLASGWGRAPVWAVVGLAAAVTLTELAVVHLQLGRSRWTLSLTEAAVAAALVVLPGAWVVLAVGLGVAGAQHLGHAPRLRREYVVVQLVTATAVAQTVAGQLGGGVLAACAAMAGFWAVHCALRSAAIALTSRRPLGSLVLSSGPVAALHTAGNCSIGLLAGYLADHAPAGLLGLFVPLALLWSSYDQQGRRDAEARLFAELARGQAQEIGRSSDLSAQVVVTAAARLLGGADVELVLLAADGPVRYVGDETGLPERRRVDSAVFDEPWVLRALGESGVTTGRDDGRPSLSAVLGDPGAPLAVLRARRGVDGSAFDRDELRLAQVLVGQAHGWLSVADLASRSRDATRRADLAGEAARALNDLGSATAPSLLLLRESADRLGRLAESAAGIDDLVEELHLAERAVASLLGARALAAEPELLVPPGMLPPQRLADEWTTTGVLA